MYVEQIIDKYGASVYSFALSRLGNEDDAADVYQNVFYKLFEKKYGTTPSQYKKLHTIK